jgi:L-2-aminoadipate reductase
LRQCEGDYPEPSHPSQEFAQRPIEACETLEISQDAQSALQQLQRLGDAQCSIFCLLLSAFMVLVSRLTGDENIAVGTRDEKRVPFVLRTAIDLNEAYQSFVARVKEV